ncbi:MAG: AMP-binding protein [Alphaproteobacteria bacterium]|nr:AMP-binding protein [Alphaproteobacteria bacterium]
MREAETIIATLSRHAGATPERLALISGDHRIRFAELHREVERVAGYLARTVPEGRGVALHLPNGAVLALLFLAACRAGREAQILDPAWPGASTRSVIATLAPALVVSQDAISGIAGVRHHRIDPEASFADVAAALGAVEAGGFSLPDPEVGVADPAPCTPFHVGFTSGSTGMPKGYRRHHRSWIESFRASNREFGIGADDSVLLPGPLTHSLFLYALGHGLHVGATVILCRQFRPTLVRHLVAEFAASVIYAVPTQLEMILEAGNGGGECFPGVRWILSSGAKWQGRSMAKLRAQFPHAHFAEFYGASELSFVTVAKDSDACPADSVGRAFEGVDLSIRDHLGRQLPRGEAGLVFVASPFLFTEYACGEAGQLVRQGEALSVGDVGIVDASGFLHLVGRASRMIISSGRNVHPEEIERVLDCHPAIMASAVLGIADALRGERLTALLQLRPQATVTRADLIRHARSFLPLYKIPRRFALAPLWPLTSSGKSDFEALRSLFESGVCEILR